MTHTPFYQEFPVPPIRTLARSVFILTMLTLLPIIASANPQGGHVAAGSATITRPGPASVVVTQTSQKAIINWHSFSINKGEQTTFAQPNARAIALNRVVGVDPSKIMGTLKANGQVWLVNPNGIVFGKTARVDVGGLLATTLNISNDDFMAGRYRFRNTNNTGAMVVNAGQITVNDAGLAALVAPGVENSGIITARLGKIQLGSTSGFTIDLGGDGTFNFLLDKQMARQLVRPDGTTPTAAISNSGSLIADGGAILLTADTARSVVNNAIDMSGYALARGASSQGGTIVLNGGDNGAVGVSGTLDASGRGGGVIKVLGGTRNGAVNVSGTLDASAPNGGNGGFIETSAAQVHVADTANITTAAPFGKTGTWLIDPHDFTIASTAVGTITNGAPSGDVSGATLNTALGSGNVTILSSEGSTSSGSGNINVNDAVSWNKNTLTLTAANDINVNAIMTLSDTASLALNPSTTNGGDAAVSPNSLNIVMSHSGGGSSVSSYTGRVDFSGTSSYSGTFSVYGVNVIANGAFPVTGWVVDGVLITSPIPLPTGGVESFLGLNMAYSTGTWSGTATWGFL